jgi:high affinity Mn2+ porin
MLLVLLGLCLALPARADESKPAPAEAPSRYTLHYQATVIDVGHARFTSPYAGKNSLQPAADNATSVTSTLFLGARLGPGTEAILNPEVSGGRGIGNTLGMAGVPNGETFRVGDLRPTIYTARLYLRQVFGLGGGTQELEDGPNQAAGTADARRATVVAGKFSLADFFDGNACSHDPRAQFMNWALMDSAAWDYPADARGYTWGLMGEYREPEWSVRGAAAAMPKEANQLDMDRRIGRAHGFVVEGERRIHAGERSGSARLLLFLNEARMGSYAAALAAPGTPDVTATRGYGRSKYGAAFSADQDLAENLGGFARLSWSDGRNETFAFTEADASEAAGFEWAPARWGRGADRWGAALIVNELSDLHRRYLAAGGLGFLLGDGALHYGPETIVETYYRFPLMPHLWVSPDAQLSFNPGYNRDRGPVPIWAVRVHAEF